MPNHVHVVAGVTPRWPLDGIVHSWKSYTAKRSNALLGRRGAFWFPEYHDRYIRDERHLAAARAYVERNPVVVGLVRTPEDWRYSSARRRTTAGGTPALPAPAGP
jgi:REP element-mobilizing transposase RayT